MISTCKQIYINQIFTSNSTDKIETDYKNFINLINCISNEFFALKFYSPLTELEYNIQENVKVVFDKIEASDLFIAIIHS